MGVSLFSKVTAVGQEIIALGCARGDSGWILGKNYSQKSGEALEWAAWGGGGTTIAGGV